MRAIWAIAASAMAMWIGASLGSKRALFVGWGITPYVVTLRKDRGSYLLALGARAALLIAFLYNTAI